MTKMNFIIFLLDINPRLAVLCNKLPEFESVFNATVAVIGASTVALVNFFSLTHFPFIFFFFLSLFGLCCR